MPGSKPGERRGGRQKGVPNKATREIKAAFQKHGPALVKALLKLTKSDDERVRLGAIQAALDRGWGKAVQAVDLGAEEQITKIERTIVGPQVIEHEGAPGGNGEGGARSVPMALTKS